MPEATDTLKWTALRHRMLREVANDGARFRYWSSTAGSPRQYEHRGRELTGAEKGCLTALLDDRLLVAEELFITTLARCLDLSESGRVLLSRWDAEHPEGGAG